MALDEPSKNPFDPLKNYSRIRWIGDRDFQDFEGNEVQQIQDYERKKTLDRVFVEGAIIAESGGTISPSTQGVHTGNIVAVSAGTYRGFFTQIYTLKVLIGGTVGATLSVFSDGEDNGVEGDGFEILLDDADPLDGSVFYDVGTHGVTVAFVDTKPIKNFVVADSWTILTTYSRRLPAVDAGAGEITPTTISLYVDGRLVFVPSATLSYAPASTGKSVIFVEILKDIVNGDADPTIKAAFTNLNVAERERVFATFKNADTTLDVLPAATIWRKVFPAYVWDRATNKVERAGQRPIRINLDEIPGQLPASALADLDFSEQLSGTLAEVVNDTTGGSFRIFGLEARVSTNTAPAGKALITVEKGKARISGLKITKRAEEDLQLDLATDTSGVTGEAKTYATGTAIYALNKSVGANRLPIEAVTSLTAIVQVVRTLTKGVLNGLDPLPDTPVSSIVSVVQGATTYVVTTSYVLNGNFVDWSAGGAEPTAGTSYDVTYRYTKQMVQPTDFVVIDSDGDGDLDSVDFTPAGDNPVNTTTFFVDYDYFQPRIDKIILRTDGLFEVIRGIPSDLPVAPRAPTEFLGIATISIAANSSTDITIAQEDNLIVTMAAVRAAIRRQEDQRRNDALQSLINQTKLADTTSFKGVLADAFASEVMSDTTFTHIAGLGGASPGTQITYAALIDLFELTLLLPVIIANSAMVKNDALLPSGSVACAAGRDFYTLPYTEVLEIDQSQYSEERNINPFASFTPPPADLVLIPNHDGGINETISTNNDIWVTWRGHLQQANAYDLASLANNHPHYHVLGRAVTEISRLVAERAGTFMRQITVEVRGARFLPGEDNITTHFDGKLVNLTPINGTSAGTLGGTVKARPTVFDVDLNVITLGGDWEATFTIPANVPTGVRTLVAVGSSGVPASGAYDGSFIERDITINQRETLTINDPLAQTFGFSSPTTITRIRIPFAQKGPNSAPPVSLQFRTVELPGGFPGRDYFEDIVRKAEALNVGLDSVNDFTFANPTYVPANTLRALVLLSDSTSYSVYSATLGRPGQNPIGFITENPNIRGLEPAGILLESLNAINWEAASRSALRYQVYRAQFAAESWLYFTRLTGLNHSQFVLNADTVIPLGTAIMWQISSDGLAVSNSSKVWIDIKPFEKLDLQALATTIDLRAKLSTTNTRITPYVGLRTISLHCVRFAAAGKSITRRADTLADVASITLYFEINRPAVCTVTYFVSNSEDVAGDPIWEAVTVVASDVDQGDGFHAIVMTKTLNNAIGDKVTLRKLRLRIDQSTSSQAFSASIRNLAATFV